MKQFNSAKTHPIDRAMSRWVIKQRGNFGLAQEDFAETMYPGEASHERLARLKRMESGKYVFTFQDFRVITKRTHIVPGSILVAIFKDKQYWPPELIFFTGRRRGKKKSEPAASEVLSVGMQTTNSHDLALKTGLSESLINEYASGNSDLSSLAAALVLDDALNLGGRLFIACFDWYTN